MDFYFFVDYGMPTKMLTTGIGILETCTYTRVRNTALTVRKFIAYKGSRTLEQGIFTRTKVSAVLSYCLFSRSKSFEKILHWESGFAIGFRDKK